VKVAHGPNGSTLVLASVTIDNRGPYTFAVDTGASTSLIDRKLAQQLGLKQAGAPQPIAGISSNEEAIPVRVTHWQAGKITLPSAIIASAALFQSQHDQELQGLLGSDIWSQFGKITIDYADGTLTVYQQVAAFGSGAIRSADALTRRLPQMPAPATA
jgi:hypothetical protein